MFLDLDTCNKVRGAGSNNSAHVRVYCTVYCLEICTIKHDQWDRRLAFRRHVAAND